MRCMNAYQTEDKLALSNSQTDLVGDRNSHIFGGMV